MIGLWSSLADAFVVRTLAAARPGWLVLDAQHGTWTDTTVSALLPSLDVPVPVWVRVPDDSPAGIGRALDAGAAGVIVPLVASPEQAAAVAAACRYPPRGRRSFGPMLPLAGRTAPTPGEADDTVRCAVMVETGHGLAAVDAIAATPGVDMVFVGPFDLSLALGRGVDDLLADDGDDAPLPRVVRACAAAGVQAGAFAGAPERAARLQRLGFTHVVAATDAGLLGGAASAALAALRPGAGTPGGTGTSGTNAPRSGY